MGHLLAADGTSLGVDDGLGVAPNALREGDLLIEVHRFATPQAGSTVWLRTGAYWLDTLARWPVSGPDGADAIFVELEPGR